MEKEAGSAGRRQRNSSPRHHWSRHEVRIRVRNAPPRLVHGREKTENLVQLQWNGLSALQPDDMSRFLAIELHGDTTLHLFFFSLANPEMTQGCYRLPNLRVLLGIGQHSNGPLLANFLEFSTGEDPVHYDCSFFFPEYIPASCHCQRSCMRDTRGTEAWMGLPSRGPCSRSRPSPFPFPISHSIHSPTDTESSNSLRLPKSLWNPKTE